MFTVVLAVDPGASGGIAWNSEGVGVQACPMPGEEVEVVELLRSILNRNEKHRIVAYMELVTGYVVKKKGELCPTCWQPKEKSEPGSRMFTFGHGAGNITGALRMAGIEPRLVSPRTWQKPYYVNLYEPTAARKTKPERKRILRDIAQRKFEGLQVTLKTADALLIHAYGAALEEGNLDGLDEAKRHKIPVPFEKPFKKEFREMIDTVAKVPVNGSEPVKPGDSSRLYIADWQGTPWVCERMVCGPDLLLHRAEPIDMANLPKK